MAIKVNPESWTGLGTDGFLEDVRLDQNPPEGAPLDLPAKAYPKRAITWGMVAIFAVLLWLAWSNSADSVVMASAKACIVGAICMIGALLLNRWKEHSRAEPGVMLNADGLNLPYDLVDPVPWRMVGAVTVKGFSIFRFISVSVDPSHSRIQKAPWLLQKMGLPDVSDHAPSVIIECSALKADPDELASDLARYRDNYCGKA